MPLSGFDGHDGGGGVSGNGARDEESSLNASYALNMIIDDARDLIASAQTHS